MWCFNAEDFWLGLKKIHSLTQHGAHILRIDVEDWREGKHWAEYRFSVEGPSKHYVLHVGHFSGDLPDAMANATGTRFSTKDTNSDQRNHACTRSYTGKRVVWALLHGLCGINTHVCTTHLALPPTPLAGGWWFNNCGETNLNGRYLWMRAKGRSMRRRGIHWRPDTGPSLYLKMTKMTVRPAKETQVNPSKTL